MKKSIAKLGILLLVAAVFMLSYAVSVSAEEATIGTVGTVQKSETSFEITVPLTGITKEATILVFNDNNGDDDPTETIGVDEIFYADQITATAGAAQFQFYIPYSENAYTLRVGGTDLTAKSQALTLQLNHAPTVTGDAAITYYEMTDITAPLATYTKADADNHETAFSLDGADKDKFAISADGKLTLVSKLDFDTAAEPKNTYNVTVVATETQTGGMSGSLAVTLTVADIAYTLSSTATANKVVPADTAYAASLLPATVQVSYAYGDGKTGTATLAVTWPETTTLVSGSNAITGIFAADATIEGETFTAGAIAPTANIYMLGAVGTGTVSAVTSSYAYDATAEAFVVTVTPTNATGQATILVFDDSANDGIDTIGITEMVYVDQTTGNTPFAFYIPSEPLEQDETLEKYIRTGGTDLIANTGILTLKANTPPVVSGTTAVTYNEMADVAVALADYEVTDADNDATAFSLTGTDADLFTIDADGKLYFKTATDFDTTDPIKNTYDVNIVATETKDGGVASAPLAVVVTVVDVTYTITGVTTVYKSADDYAAMEKPTTVSVAYSTSLSTTGTANLAVTWPATFDLAFGNNTVTGEFADDALILGDAFDAGSYLPTMDVYRLGGGTGTVSERTVSYYYDETLEGGGFVVDVTPTNATSRATILVFDDSLNNGIGSIDDFADPEDSSEFIYVYQIDDLTATPTFLFFIPNSEIAVGESATYYLRTGGTGLTANTTELVLKRGVAPVISGPATQSFAEMTAAGTAIATYTADKAVTWKLEGNDADLFTIDANGKLAPKAAYDYEATDAQTSFDVSVIANDGDGGGVAYDVALTLTNVSYEIKTVTNPANGADVAIGTTYTEITKPATVNVVLTGSTEPIAVDVVWTEQTIPETAGEVTLQGTIKAVNGEEYTFATGAVQPTWKFNVAEPNSKITALQFNGKNETPAKNFYKSYAAGTAFADMDLPTTLTATINGNEVTDLGVTWTPVTLNGLTMITGTVATTYADKETTFGADVAQPVIYVSDSSLMLFDVDTTATGVDVSYLTEVSNLSLVGKMVSVALYNWDGKLVDVRIQRPTVEPGTLTGNVMLNSVSFDDADIDYDTAIKVKVFVWQNMRTVAYTDGPLFG